MSENKFPKITEAGLDDLRSRIGVKIENTVEPWNYEATRDAIRHYAHGIGDDKRLWRDPEYASQTTNGPTLHLPSFPFTQTPPGAASLLCPRARATITACGAILNMRRKPSMAQSSHCLRSCSAQAA